MPFDATGLSSFSPILQQTVHKIGGKAHMQESGYPQRGKGGMSQRVEAPGGQALGGLCDDVAWE